jgi:hypothetical protein
VHGSTEPCLDHLGGFRRGGCCADEIDGGELADLQIGVADRGGSEFPDAFEYRPDGLRDVGGVDHHRRSPRSRPRRR